MLDNEGHLDEIIDGMRDVSNELITYTYPRSNIATESKIDLLKQRSFNVDGYDLLVHFSIADYSVCRVESLEIIGLHYPFLPMSLVCKLGVRFLGGHNLKYAESFKGGRKVYIWTVAIDDRGRPMPLVNSLLSKRLFEGLSYYVIDKELL